MAETQSPKCPVCGAEMVLRVAKRGPNIGSEFYACSNYFKTKCPGKIDLSKINNDLKNQGDIKEQVDLDVHYIPTKTIAKPYYPEFDVSFYQSIAIPFNVLQMINQDEISSKELLRYSQWRADSLITKKSFIQNDVRNVFTLMKKILTRGMLTLASERLESDLAKIFNVNNVNYKEFTIDCYVVQNHIRDFINIDLNNNEKYFDIVSYEKNFDKSFYEKNFYYNVLPLIFGDFYRYHTLTQVSIESLIESDSISTEFEQRRADFLITTNENSYVVEINGEEHRTHKDRDNNRYKLLEQSGYKVIVIQYFEDYPGEAPYECFKVIKASDTDDLSQTIRSFGIKDWQNEFSRRNLSNMEKCMVSEKLVHQIMLAVVDTILKGYDYSNSKTIYLNFASEFIDNKLKKKLCGVIQNEFNELLYQISKLFKIDHLVGEFAFLPFKNYTEDLTISFGETCIDLTNTVVISDIFINKVISNTITSSSLKYYDSPEKENLEYFLNYIFRKKSFREGQYETIFRGLQGKDTLVLLPTGAGKSIAFQLTSLLFNGITLVIDPIIALINDQIENLKRIGIDRVAGITSLLGSHKIRQNTMKAFSMGEYLITYISPERLQSDEFRTAIEGLTTITPIPLVAIDEAHCVSEWGHDFRTSYLNIGRISRKYCGLNDKKPCLIGLTGTASNAVLRDVQRELDIKDFDAIITPKTFDREELSYAVFKCPSQNKIKILNNLLNRYFPEVFMTSNYSLYSQKGEETRCGLVFCPHVNGEYGVKKVSDLINSSLNLQSRIYSGEKPKYMPSADWNKEKSITAHDFKNNKFNLLVSTKAFGMGIDKPNINYTVHYGIPNSIEAFYQEAGRAGRNGAASKCVLLVSNDRPERAKEFLDPQSSIMDLKRIMNDTVDYENGDDISRAMFFHLNAFKGIEEELKGIKFVLSKINNLEISNKLTIKANKDYNRNAIEKALYRLIILGPVTDYTLDYSCDEFTVDYYLMDKDQIVDRYAMYVSGYNKTRINRETEKLHNIFELPYLDFVTGACQVLISFIYDTIEKGRRRGISEVLMLAEAALKSENPDEVIRKRILRYLETTYAEEIERILNVEELKLELIRDLIDGYETSDGRVIGGLRSYKDAEEIRGQVSRYLESSADHPGLLILRALSEMFCSDCDKSIVTSTLEAAIKYANEQVGYSIYASEFYKMIAWSICKIGERDVGIYNEIIKDLLLRFENIEFAKYLFQYSLNNNQLMLYPSQFILNASCDKINQILRRDRNV